MLTLPIDAVIAPLFTALSTRSQVILSAPPGAGKSTQLPLRLLSEFPIQGKILLLEPRKLAARNIAQFLAAKLGESIGEQVGLRMRGETRVSARTKLEIITEGVLTRMLQHSPDLDGVGLVIFDEFHERSLHADLGLALCLDIQQGLREDLKLLIMSATLDNDGLSKALPDAAQIQALGQSYPVTLTYQPLSAQSSNKQGDNNRLIAQKVVHLLGVESGSMLVFLPGAREITKLAALLATLVSDDVDIFPLYGQLSAKAQQAAIAPSLPSRRKVVLATNIAETSLTIDGIRMVVDLGLERSAHYHPKSGITRLETRQISRAGAIQRMGRAGRLESGICMRLYSAEQFSRMVSHAAPEVLTADLTQLQLELVRWGCQAQDLIWLDMPHPAHLATATALLTQLGLVTVKASAQTVLTPKAKKVLAYHSDPRIAVMLDAGCQLGAKAAQTACWLAAWVESPFAAKELDLHLVLALIQDNFSYLQRARQLAASLGIKLADKQQISAQDLPLLVAAGWPDRIAQARANNGSVKLANGVGARMDTAHPLAFEPYIATLDLMMLSDGEGQIFTACALDIKLLEQHFPHLFSSSLYSDWDDDKGKVIAENRLCCGELVIERQALSAIEPAVITAGLLAAVRRHGLASLEFDGATQALLTRARYAKAQGLLTLPALDDASLLAALELWLAPFLNEIKTLQQLKKQSQLKALQAWLGWQQMQQLDALLPERYQLPTGNFATIEYYPDQTPRLAVRMQEMFGQASTPAIAEGKIKLVVALLSPAHRPLQITQDLANFWQTGYKEVQKEMKGRYPKHIWPDDPANHPPTLLTKRHFQSK